MAYAAASLQANQTRANRLAVQIGGFSLGLWCVGGMPVTLDPEHEPFLLRGAGPKQTCNIELDIDWAETLELPADEPSFVSGGLWSAYVSPTGTKFYFASPAIGGQPYKAAWFDSRFERGHVVLNRSAIPAGHPIFPLEYPLDELVLMHRLALGEGVEVHALGLADDSGGYLFLGHSGAGKSTTARLWLSQAGVQMLSDDRIILREHDHEIWMYGTPWHGDAGIASPARARLSRIFVLEQAPVEELIPLSQGQAAAELFARAFVPFYQKSAVQFSLGFLDQVTRSVPCCTFRFTPTASAVEAIRHARV